MKNKIAVRSEYFKRTQASGLKAHIKREFENDKNVLDPKLTRQNFGVKSETIELRYERAMKAMPDTVQNTLIDSVLVFPLEQFEEMKKEHPKEWKNKIHSAINDMMKEMQDEFGFEPLGYKMHLDEGHFDADGNAVINPHAHMLFANICTKDITLTKTKNVTLKDENGKAMKDPKNPRKYLYELDEFGATKKETTEIKLKGRAPLSLHQTRGKDSIWSRQQDIAAKYVKHLGFERGLSKEITGAVHQKKVNYVNRKLSEKERELESMTLASEAKSKEIHELEVKLEKAKGFVKAKLQTFVDTRENLLVAMFSDRVEESIKEGQKLEKLFDSMDIESQEVALKAMEGRIETFEDDPRIELANEELKRLQELHEAKKTKKAPSQELSEKPKR